MDYLFFNLMGNKTNNNLSQSITNAITFKNISINSNVNELYTQTTFKFEANNNQDKHIDLKLSLPLLPNSVMISFEAEIGCKKIKSKVYTKEKSEEKFTDSVASGNNAFLSSLNTINSKKYIDLSLGNLQPNETLIISIHTVELNQSQDKSVKLCFSNYQLPKFSNIEIKEDIDIEIDIKISTAHSLTRLISTSHENIKFNLENENKKAEVSLNSSSLNKTDLIILFRTSQMTNPIVFEEKNLLTDSYTYSICHMFDNYNNISENSNFNTVDTDSKTIYTDKYDKEAINDFPGNFYFIVDQSGSMSGQPMEIAKEGLILFLKSLPEKSKYNIIGFGSSYKYYHSHLQEYNEENLANSLNLISGIRADLGGTEIDSPLTSIYYNNNDKTDKNIPTYIILLTDGCVSNKEIVIDLIKANSDKYILSSIGIGGGVDSDLIIRCGKAGKGGYWLAYDVSNLKNVVINSLNDCLKPYMSDVKIEVSDELKSKVICSYQNSNKFVKQDEIFNYSFISKERIDENSSVQITYKDYSLNSEVKKTVSFHNKRYLEGDTISKLIVGLYLDECKETEENINLALKYQIMSKFTNLFVEVEADNVILEKIPIDLIVTNELNPPISINKNFKDSNIFPTRSINSISSLCSSSSKGMKRCEKQNFSPFNNISKECENTKSLNFFMPSNNNLNIPSCKEDKNMDCLLSMDIESESVLEEEDCEDEKLDLKSNNYQQTQLKSYYSVDDTFYKFIISSQTIEGSWKYILISQCKEISDSNFARYYKNLQKLQEYLVTIHEFQSKNSEDKKNILSTIFFIHVLENLYSKMQGEFKLIVNKSRKYLMKNSINNDFQKESFTILNNN